MTDFGKPDEARAFLEPYFPTLVGINQAAWKKWEDHCQHDPSLRVVGTGRLCANFINDYLIQFAHQKFDPSSEVVILDHLGFAVLNFQDQVLLRLKKLDRNLRHSNVATRQQRRYDSNMRLPGLPPLPHLVFGYQLDRLHFAIADMLITYPSFRRRGVVWAFSVIGDQGLPMPLFDNLPPIVPPPSDGRPPRKPNTRIKRKGNDNPDPDVTQIETGS